MSMLMLEISSVRGLRETLAGWRAAGDSIALVPTMGALHAGHMALVKAAQAQATRVVVSIFVNPTQFGPNEDFSRYPRPLTRDLELLRAAGVDAAWLPTVEEMYPQGFATHIHVAGVSAGLEGDVRAGHFDGVATVVAKLLLQVMPEIALFGEKDYQQLCVIRQMLADMDIPVRILGVPTVREADGLALSSRNQYLTPEQRAVAPQLYAQLQALAMQLAARSDDDVQAALERAKESLVAAGFDAVDYLELRAENSLAPLTQCDRPARLLVAARLGATRLLDNISVAPAGFS
ncbi:MAG: pantoate--beta-alanine ligase [Alphaproteobacteria bacterium]|nr:pantoate--beta-alanine ligase [Alphaproteobacteria bacterium]